MPKDTGVSKDSNPGRVRVALRVRPNNEMEIEEQHTTCVETEPETGKVYLKKNQWETDNYQFDAVFGGEF
jgi:hypothetical protein